MLDVNSMGVGSLNVTAAEPRAEAENFFKIANATKTAVPGGGANFEVSGLRPGSMLYYAKVFADAPGKYKLSLHASNGGQSTGTVTVSDGQRGTKLASCTLKPTGGWTVYRDVLCDGLLPLGPANGTDLQLTFDSDAGPTPFANLDRWQILSS